MTGRSQTFFRWFYIASILLFTASMFLPALKFPNHNYLGWEAARETIARLVQQNAAVPAVLLLDRPPRFALLCGALCLAGFAAVLISLKTSRPTVIWFRFGTAAAVFCLAVSIPVQLEGFRATNANADYWMATVTMDDTGHVLHTEVENPDVSRETDHVFPHRNWSVGYFCWTLSFLLMAVGALIQFQNLWRAGKKEVSNRDS